MPIQSEPVLVPGILLSDLTIVEQGTGKRSIIGGFEQFTFPQFPVTYGRFFVNAWITNLVGSVDQFEITCRVEEKGSAHVIFSTSANMKLPPDTTFTKDVILAISAPVAGMTFPKPGMYVIVLLLNGDEVGKRDFVVQQTATPLNQ